MSVQPAALFSTSDIYHRGIFVQKSAAMRQVYLGKEAVCVAKLSARQELFCLEYIRDGNATQAAIRAGYSPKTANPMSSRL